MKILFFSNVALNLSLFRLPIMAALKADGNEIVALAADDGRSASLVSGGFRFCPIKLDRKGWRVLSEYASYAAFLKKEKPDLVLCFTPKPALFGSFARIFFPYKTVCFITGLGYAFLKRSLFTLIVRLAFRVSLPHADRVIFQNQDDLDLFVSAKLVPAPKTGLIRSSGVDTDYFLPRQQPERSPGSVVFLYVGRLLWDKGVGEFVEAAEKVLKIRPEAAFHIIGWYDPGNPSAVPEEFIRRKEKDGIVKYLGMLEDIRPLIAESDVVVLPSYREGTPRSLLEAASMARPVITTDVPGCREVVRDGATGLLVRSKDSDALVRAMVWMLDHRDERARMGRAGREFMIARFDVKQVVAKYLDIVKSI